jgi:hypothetical protein
MRNNCCLFCDENLDPLPEAHDVILRERVCSTCWQKTCECYGTFKTGHATGALPNSEGFVYNRETIPGRKAMRRS